MKKTVVIIALILLFFAQTGTAGTEYTYDGFLITETLTADEAGEFTAITTENVIGYVVRISTIIGSTAPTSGAADFYVKNLDGTPISGAALENLDTSNNGSFLPMDSNGSPTLMYVKGPLQITGEQNLQSGASITIKIYVRTMGE